MLKRMMMVLLAMVLLALTAYAAVAESGTLELRFTGDEGVAAAYSISADEQIYAQGDLAVGKNILADNLSSGNYTVTIDLPQDVLLMGINGYDSLQRDQAQWLAAVETDKVSVYEVELRRACTLAGVMPGTADVRITLSGTESCVETVSGAFTLTGLAPDTYTVTALLPAGTYTGEGWRFDEIDNHVQAITTVRLAGGLTAEVPAISAVNDAQLHENHGSVLVKVFVDANNNAVYATNESLLEGVVVTLISMQDGEEVVVDAAMTDEAGEAELWAEPGNYILRCEMPQDYAYNKKGSKTIITHSQLEQSIDRVQEASVSIVKGEQTEFGVGAAQMCVVSGTVWLDENGDGLWQSDEPRVAGMHITADGARNDLHYETVTDENGYFEIRQIRNGTYNLAYYVPDGYVFTYKTSSGTKAERSVMTTEADRVGKDQVIFDKGDKLENQNIGLVQQAVIEGVCFLDANHNGLFDDGEEVLAGVDMNLYRQSNSKLLRTVTSDENGVFRFEAIRGDTFKIKAILPKGLSFSMTIPGDENANQFGAGDGKREYMLKDVDAFNAQTTRLLVGAISYGSITGVVYQDDNFSGAWETGEKLAQGVAVTLLDENGSALMTAKTNKSGSYTFDSLAPGQYSISVSAQAGFAFTITGEGSVVENVGVELGVSVPFDLAMGENLTGMNAGMIKPAKVSGVVFADKNDNGLRDAGEMGLTGAVVTLMQGDAAVDSTVIPADGKFVFDPVLPGEYYLSYTLPEEAFFASVVKGGNQLTGDGAGETFKVGMGDVYTAHDCGGLYLGEISGVTFGDSDGSGMMNGSESPLAGVTLTLTPSRDDLDMVEVVTGADGSFIFAELHPDTYTLTVICPEGYVLSQLIDVTLPLSHGVNGQTVAIEVGMGAEWLNQALGCVKPSRYSGMAWLDENLNGLHDEGELAAAGETILMIEQRSGLVAAEMTTAEDGSFRAEGLAPGMYTLSYAMSEGVYGAMDGDSTFNEEETSLVMADIEITEGTEKHGAKLGLVRETTLQGRVWLDSDGEIEMVAGAEVTLLQDGMAVETIVTGEDGLYTFAGLLPDEYAIVVTLPGKLLALEPDDRRITDGSLISILAVNDGAKGESGVFTVVMGQHQLQLDIGSVKAGRLGDLCWLDLNGNGLQDSGEGGIPGVQITLMRNGAAVAETVSDQYGYYIFEGIYPGEYTLRVNAPQQVKPTVLRDDIPPIVSVLTENGESIPVPVVSDGVNYAADLGFVLVNENEYPAGYGEGATQDWTKP